MDVISRYNISFKGLGQGSHRFEMAIQKPLFEAFENKDILDADVAATVDLVKHGSGLTLTVTLSGNITVECDRCLDDLILPVDYNSDLEVKFSDGDGEYDGDTMFIPRGEDSVNIGQYLYESVILSLPFKRVHEVDKDGNIQCDPEMLSKFSIVTQDEFTDMFADNK